MHMLVYLCKQLVAMEYVDPVSAFEVLSTELDTPNTLYSHVCESLTALIAGGGASAQISSV
jgi:hypothetical protein